MIWVKVVEVKQGGEEVNTYSFALRIIILSFCFNDLPTNFYCLKLFGSALCHVGMYYHGYTSSALNFQFSRTLLWKRTTGRTWGKLPVLFRGLGNGVMALRLIMISGPPHSQITQQKLEQWCVNMRQTSKITLTGSNTTKFVRNSDNITVVTVQRRRKWPRSFV